MEGEHTGGILQMNTNVDLYVADYNFPVIEEPKEKPLVVIGTGPTMWEDISKICVDCDYMAINKASVLYTSKIKYMASLHWENIKLMRRERKNAGGNSDYTTFSKIKDEGVDKVFHFLLMSGSSGLYGIMIGQVLGYQKIILCGIPLTKDKGLELSNGAMPSLDVGVGIFQDNWIRYKSLGILDNVRSYSGFTKDLLGYPTNKWIQENYF